MSIKFCIKIPGISQSPLRKSVSTVKHETNWRKKLFSLQSQNKKRRFFIKIAQIYRVELL